MRASAREWQKLGCAAVLGAIIAFPAGILFSGRGSEQQQTTGSNAASVPAGAGQTRKPYSPDVLGDPYVLQQHREIVEQLEMSCHQTGESCAEARQARRYLREREAPRAR
jgi:hypothetical protein